MMSFKVICPVHLGAFHKILSLNFIQTHQALDRKEDILTTAKPPAPQDQLRTFVSLFLFETGSCLVAQADTELTV
jgi:hypothetical protein